MNVAVVVLADTDEREGQARGVNVVGTIQECLEAGDEVRVLFDGAGTQWPLLLAGGAHPMGDVWERVQGQAAVCSRCATRFDVAEDVRQQGVTTSGGDGHFSIRGLMEDGYEVLTF